MKKITMVLLSILLVLSMGQAALAKANVGIVLGYKNETATSRSDSSKPWEGNGVKFALSGGYDFTKNFSLFGKFGVNFMAMNHLSPNNSWKAINMNFELFAKYTVLNLNIAQIALQIGIIDSIFTGYQNNRKVRNNFMIAPGVYGEITFLSKINLYTDLKFPLAFFDNYTDKYGFFKVFLYDVVLGVSYIIDSNISSGIEFKINNTTYEGIQISHSYPNFNYLNFSIGAKVGYTF